MANLIAKEYEAFEQIKKTNENGNEYWLARDLQNTLNYANWQNFSKVLDRAMLACKNSGNAVSEHFIDASKTIKFYQVIGQARKMGAKKDLVC